MSGMRGKSKKNTEDPGQLESCPVVLLVDDNIECLMIYKALAESLGCKVYSALDGVSGVEVLRGLTRVDVVFLDLDMPLMNGLGFYNQLKKQKLHESAKIILTSSHPFAGDISEALGLFAHAPKNTAIEKLQALLTSALVEQKS